MTEPGSPQQPLADQRIVLGVTGSIACYKAADLASKLAQAGAVVDTILTRAATEFIKPLTFSSLTGRRAYVDGDLWGDEAHVLHRRAGDFRGRGEAVDVVVDDLGQAAAHRVVDAAGASGGDRKLLLCEDRRRKRDKGSGRKGLEHGHGDPP